MKRQSLIDSTPAQRARWEGNRKRANERLTGPPILLGGCGRSGTTLLLSILSAHPRVWAIGPETNRFCPTGYAGSPNLAAPFEMDLSFYQYFDGLPADGPFDRWCEKTPRNILYFNRLIDFFKGHVRLIQIIRDGRDVVVSRHPANADRYWVAVDRWVRDIEAGLAVMDHPLVHTMRYEELIRDNERVVRGMCAFLELPYGQQMADWHKHATVRENPAWDGAVKPLFESSIGKWRLPEHADRMAELMANPRAAELLETLGYVD